MLHSNNDAKKCKKKTVLGNKICNYIVSNAGIPLLPLFMSHGPMAIQNIKGKFILASKGLEMPIV